MGSLIDLTGKKFGDLTILKRGEDSGRGKWKKTRWISQCSCGEIFNLEKKSLLRHKNRKGCKKCSPLGRKNLKNKTFGQLSVLDIDPKEYRTPSGSKYICWICKCSCGKIISVQAGYLYSGQTTRCQKCHYKSRELNGHISALKIKRIKYCAKKRNIYLDESIINKKYLWELYLKQNKKCSLSGVNIKFAENNYEESYKRGTTASLDRINPKKGYIKNNIQWVHKDINSMKYTRLDKEFIKICKEIVDYKKEEALPLLNNTIGNIATMNRIKQDAKKRNISIHQEVTVEYLYKLYLQQNKKCILTGRDIYLAQNKKELPINTASLDRIDSSKSYTTDNVQWLHKDINIMKWAFSEEYFLNLCRKVVEHNS